MKIKIYLLLISAVFSYTAFSQLDSASVTVSFSSEVDSSFFDIDSSLVTVDFMSANVWLNEPLLLGDVLISVYETQSGQPMARKILTLAEIQSNGGFSANSVLIPVGYLDANLTYEIHVLIRNFQLAYLEELIISYP